ncbi:DUF5605 domain-containing protein [Bacillus sp. AFS031507]|uniref:DUF5605 domain-containing protein n=1 Tax=Bacillus sp. AFS031507 TaxID=2033496 RepID=UPI000BFC1056|nr:DUF5605 domain-containing protein [Bacillus sp. AFS031507]PGY10664.1 DUF5060 domain-containing protein [Bacillus sp. AFS031507]
MEFTEKTKLGNVLSNKEARGILEKHIPQLFDLMLDPSLGTFIRLADLPQLASYIPELTLTSEIVTALQQDLAKVSEESEDSGEITPATDYENESVPRGSAAITLPDHVDKWGVFELKLQGPDHGNPFVDVALSAEFSFEDRTLETLGFYDGEGVYRIRFMPDTEGSWAFRTKSSARSLDRIEGQFVCKEALEGNQGPVRVQNTFHFAHEDGTRYIPVGTTCYAWVHQEENLIKQTLETLGTSPFNKLRMCVFPKSYSFNTNEPPFYPYEGSIEEGWDNTRFNPLFFQHLEQRIIDLGKLGIEADLILFHPYDRWGFADMKKGADDRYLRYIVARLSAYRHVWWSLANEYDLMWSKKIDDWERFAKIITEIDPYNHLISIHNCLQFYDYNRPWITHCSVQRIDVYKTAESTDEWRKQWKKPIVIDECAYEGDIDQGWGNIPGEEMTRRFWEGALRGGYVGHGETYLRPDEVLWWSKGGKLHGSSPDRIAFLRGIMEEGPKVGLNPLQMSWDAPAAGIPDEYYLFYYGFNQPRFREYRMKPETKYKVEVIDTWNMTINELEEIYEGKFRIELPGRQYMAVRMSRI